MTKICSWCQRQMVVPIRRTEPSDPAALPTYGMCGSCLEAELEALAPRRRPIVAAR